MASFWSDPYLYVSVLGLAVSLSALFYLVHRWRLSWAHDEELSIDIERAVSVMKAVQAPPAPRPAPKLEPKAPAAAPTPAPSPAKEPPAPAAEAPRAEAPKAPAPAAASVPGPEKKLTEEHSLSEIVDHLNFVHEQIKDLQYLLQGLEFKRGEELHDIQRRLKEIEERIEGGPSKPKGPIFPV